MSRLREEGFRPDVVAAHPGWGEALFVKDVFPEARFITYAEYFYGGAGSDTDFDPEFPLEEAEAGARIRIKNMHLLQALNDCDAAMTPTRFQKERHPAWAQERMHVIHDGIDTNRFRPDPSATVSLRAAGVTLSAGDEVVTFACRHLEPYRGYHVFMRALPLLQRLRPQARVVIVGGDDTSYGAKPPSGTTWKQVFLQEVARELDPSRVHFVGQVPHARLTQLMQVSSAHVYLTYPFVLSWSLLEAMSTGCLIVGSDTAPVREVIEHGRSGILTDFFDAQKLATTIAQTLEQGDALRPLREQARQTIRERFDLRRLCLPAQLALLGAV
jgi:glycosyltransferase involved in cell wall biosynthesis